MAVVYSKVLLFDPPLIYTAPDTCVFGAVHRPILRELLAELAVESDDSTDYTTDSVIVSRIPPFKHV